MRKKAALAMVLLVLLVGCRDEKPESASFIYAAPPQSVAASARSENAASAPLHPPVSLPRADGDTIYVTEKLFIAQINDIYLNGEEYLGKTICYEGLYKNTAEWDDGSDEVVHFVIRYGPGCCGYDGEAGFEIRWDGPWPQVDDWVEVIGVIEEESYASGYKILYVNLTSLTVKEERGAEFVAT